MGHYRSCESWPCEAQIWQAECIYDEGTVTKEPTCTENGIKEYVCTAENCACDTKHYTEEIPALGHDWGEWTPSLTDSTKEERVCKRDPSHTEERTAHEHSWSNWVDDHTTETHTRQCTLEGCTAKETEPHNWNSGVQSGAASCTEGAKTTYTCSDCGATKTETGEELGHDWGEWVYDSVDSHIRNCKRNCGVEEEFGGHEWGEWQVYDENTHRMYCDICHGYQEEDHDWNGGVETVSPTCYSTGVMTYTCGTCHRTKTEKIPMSEHIWSDWAPNGDENHKRDCMDDNCDKVETLPHDWDDGEVTTEPSCTEKGVKTFTCQVCLHTKTEDLPKTDHQWTDWSSNGDGTHTRACRCNANEINDCTYNAGVVTTEPTHTEKGVKTYTCTTCNHTYTEDIPKTTEHTFGDWQPDASVTGKHYRDCACGERDVDDCTWDSGNVGVGTVMGSYFIDYTCTGCGAHMTKNVNGSQVRFENCEGLETNPVIFVQRSDEETYKVALPCADDIAAREGFILIGWTASIDGVTYSAGNELFIRYADGVSITFTAEWATVLGEGEQKLEQNTPYYVDSESFELEGEGIAYRGEQVFYVPKNGLYTLINVTKQKEVPQQ
jgi:DNA-directed RNA polymerase subunit RPC12/RpoP